MKTLSGGCLCGTVRYEISGKVDSTCHCHCRACRRTTGAAISTWTNVDMANFTITAGDPETYSSTEMGTRWFCPRCGSQIAFQHAGYADFVDITVHSLDHPDKLPPERHLWASRKISWMQIDDHLPKLQED
jgi:hypothetical protein